MNILSIVKLMEIVLKFLEFRYPKYVADKKFIENDFQYQVTYKGDNKLFLYALFYFQM